VENWKKTNCARSHAGQTADNAKLLRRVCSNSSPSRQRRTMSRRRNMLCDSLTTRRSRRVDGTGSMGASNSTLLGVDCIDFTLGAHRKAARKKSFNCFFANFRKIRGISRPSTLGDDAFRPERVFLFDFRLSSNLRSRAFEQYMRY